MTWQAFFNFSTMPHRHLVFAYMTVLAIQGGYCGWIAWKWRQIKSPNR